MNNLVGDVKANSRDFYQYINGKKKDAQDVQKGVEVMLPSHIFKRQKNSMVSSRMCSIKMNIARSFF